MKEADPPSADGESYMETIYSSLKINNEYELCNVYSEEAKVLLEQALLKARISYYISFPRRKLFDRHKFKCIFCVNENSLAEAEDIVYDIFGEDDPEIRMISQKNPVDYL